MGFLFCFMRIFPLVLCMSEHFYVSGHLVIDACICTKQHLILENALS
jgi:hypothetical protein